MIGAPFEADWQLIALEKEGRTAGTITIDSDLFALGGRTIVDLLRLRGKDPQPDDKDLSHTRGACAIIQRPGALSKLSEKLGAGPVSDEVVVVFSVMSGCDYLRHVKNHGMKAARSKMKRWLEAGGPRTQKGRAELKKILGELEKKEAGYVVNFDVACNVFRYAPVIQPPPPTTVSDGDVADGSAGRGSCDGNVTTATRRSTRKTRENTMVGAIGGGGGGGGGDGDGDGGAGGGTRSAADDSETDLYCLRPLNPLPDIALDDPDYMEKWARMIGFNPHHILEQQGKSAHAAVTAEAKASNHCLPTRTLRTTHCTPCTTHHAPHHAPRTTHHAPRTMHHAPCTTYHAPRTTHQP